MKRKIIMVTCLLFFLIFINNIKTINVFNEKLTLEDKIRELLYQKYPFKIAQTLDNYAKVKYEYKNNYLLVTYLINKDVLDTNRVFELKISYNDIKDYVDISKYEIIDILPDDGFNYDKNKKTIIFTFDDGPHKKNTLEILNTLEEYKMSATFFMVGEKFSNNQEIIKKVYASHSDVGYHSYNHSILTKEDPSKITDEFEMTDNLYYLYTKSHLNLTRPPYGLINDKVLKSINTSFILWDLDTNDWKYKDAKHIEKYVLNNINNGDIILFHDSYKSTVKAIKKLCEKLYLMDVQVLSINEYASLYNINLEKGKIYYSFK